MTETQVRISSLVDCVQERFVRRLVIFYFFIFVCVATLPSLYVLIPYLGMRERDGFFYIIFVVILGFFFFKSGKLDRLSTNLKNFNRNLFKKACELNWTCLILKKCKNKLNRIDKFMSVILFDSIQCFLNKFRLKFFIQTKPFKSLFTLQIIKPGSI